MTPDAYKRRLLALREEQVVAGGRTFTVRRLGELAIARLREKHRGDSSAFVVDLVRQSVVGWDMDEASLFVGGGDSAVPFDTDLFVTCVEDQADVYAGLANGILEMISRHREQREASAKN